MNIATLHATFRNLRQRWPRRWPGLPVVLRSCMRQLWPAGLPDTPGTARVIECALDVCARVEAWGASQAALDSEPEYHNRLHVADALVSLTALLLAQRSACPAHRQPEAHTECLMLLAMAAHDMMHKGGVNSFPEEMEIRSVRHFNPFLKRHGLRHGDRERVCGLILATDPATVSEMHRRARLSRFDPEAFVWQSVLIEEADILASALPDIGEDLGHSLAVEWAAREIGWAGRVATAEGRLQFLAKAALFTSPASHALGLHEVVEGQLIELRTRRLPRPTARRGNPARPAGVRPVPAMRPGSQAQG